MASTPQPGPPVPIALEASGANGEGRIETVRHGLLPLDDDTKVADLCEDGAQRAYWNYEYGTELPVDARPGGGGELRMHLAVHSVEVRTPGVGEPPDTAAPTAFLLGETSYVSVLDNRGTLKLALRSGTCTDPTLAFDGTTTSGSGTWEVVRGQGAYRDATGSGTFAVVADVGPGADNPFSIQLDGQLAVLQPELEVEVVGSEWRGMGTDYVSRRPTVVFRVTNTGAGDAFDAEIVEVRSSTTGVRVLSPLRGRPLGDLRAGESETVRARFQLGLIEPCSLVLLGCAFSTTTEVEWSDTLRVTTNPARTRQATAPDLPPPL